MEYRSGETELGSSNVIQFNMDMEMRSFFPEEFSRQLSPVGYELHSQPTDPNRPSSSSSSLRSLSTGSPDSSLIFNIPTACCPRVPTENIPSSLQAISASINDPHQQVLSQMRSDIQFPTLESENAVMTEAILAVLTSPCSSSSSTSHHTQQNLILPYNYRLNPKASAFNRYVSVLGAPATPVRASLRAQSVLKRTIMFYRKINSQRREQLLRSCPTANQLHHMMSERKRREKLNESFNALRSLLPPGTKKDKASVLNSSREYLTFLKAEIAELNRQNQLLKTQLLPSRKAAGEVSSERLNVRIAPVSESTSDQGLVDLRVSVRGERPMVDFVIPMLEFLKLDRNVNLTSVEANTQATELGSDNHLNMRLRIEGNEWDESTFLEAVRRLDLAQ